MVAARREVAWQFQVLDQSAPFRHQLAEDEKPLVIRRASEAVRQLEVDSMNAKFLLLDGMEMKLYSADSRLLYCLNGNRKMRCLGR